MNAIALGAALASATGFAASTSLQHRAAGDAARAATGLVGFVRQLLARPTWVLGQVLALMSFFLHAVALHYGPLALVQPIVVAGVVIAVPARSALSRRWPGSHELWAVTVATVGLAVFLVASDPSDGEERGSSGTALVFTLLAVAIAAAAAWASVRSADGKRAAAYLGVTAGVLFGTVAGLVKLTVAAAVADGAWSVLGNWSLYALVLCGAGGIISNQRAYTLASLSASLPVLNIVNVLAALLFGLLVFVEVPAHDPVSLSFQLLAAATATLGLREIARVEDAEPAPVA